MVTNTRQELTARVLKDIDEHRDVQLGVWGVQNNSPEMWQLIAQEEFGEIAGAIKKAYLNPSHENWGMVYEETVHTLAVLIAFSESLLAKYPNLEMPFYDIPKMKKVRGIEK